VPRRLQCHGCRHFEWGWLDSDRCAAFPGGVPDDIWLGEVDHALPYAGDGGVRRAPHAGDVANLRDVRHHAFWATTFEEVTHAADPLGAIVLEVERLETHGADANTAHALDALRAAWRRTADAPAMMLVLLRARRARELALAVQLTSEQLELEGCDFLDDKGWLGVTLGLASFRTEAAFEDPQRAWAALSAPLDHRYLTARVQQTLLRSMRRVVPEPPDTVAWTGPGRTSPGKLEDAGVVLRLAARRAVRFEDVELLSPWTALTNAAGVEAELARELREGHPLFGRRGLRAVARRSDSNEVLFVDDTLAAVVHLTWAREVAPPEPRAEIHPSIAEWVVRRMHPDHDDFTGAEPRSFAFSFKSALGLEELARRLPDDDRWDWTLRGSHWYGDYIWGKSGPTRVRVFVAEGGERYTIQADLDRDDPGEGWFAVARAVTTKTLLAAMDATDVQACAPAYD
jgi:hypothetical protein